MWIIYLIIGIALVLLFIIRSKIKKQKKELEKLKEKEPKEDDLTDEKNQKAQNPKLKILIFRQLGKDLVAQIGKPIIAQETYDNNNNLIAINEEKRFKEDLNFSKDRIFEAMEYSLGLKNKDKLEKLTILKQSIENQEQLIKEIDADVNLNKTYNALDEDLKLRQLKVLFKSIKNGGEGNYMRLGYGGIRQYEFVAIDGILYPYIFGTDLYRVYPDLLVKKKIFNQENAIFRNEMANLFAKNLPIASLITLVVGLITIAIGVGALWYDNQSEAELSAMANQGTITCTNTLSQITQNYGGIINDYLAIKQAEIGSIKNNQNNNNNNVPSIGDIWNIDPSKINNK